MYTTPVINGYVYQIQNGDLNAVLQHLAELLQLSKRTTILNPQIGTSDWGTAFLEGSAIATLYTQLSSEITALTGPGIDTSGAQGVANYINTSTIPSLFADLQNEGGYSAALFNQRQAFVQAIYNLRQDLPALIRTAFANLKDNYDETIILRPALQDYVLFQYALTGETLLNEDLNTLGDAIKANSTTLEGVNKLNQILGQPITLNQDLSPTNPFPNLTSLATEGLNQIKNDSLGFIKGNFTFVNLNSAAANTWQLNFASDTPSNASLFEVDQVVQIPTNTQPSDALYVVTYVTDTYIQIAPQGVASATPNDFLPNTNPVQGVYSYQQQTTLSPIVVANLFEVIADPNFLNYIATGSTTWFQTVASHTNLSNTIANLEFFKEQKTQELNKVMFVYSKFLQSAASALSNIDQATSGFARRIKSQ